jgi:hypothetical protein
MEYALASPPRAFSRYRVNLLSVYGADWALRALDLYRYYCKHLGCALAEPRNAVRIAIPEDIPRFLDGGPPPSSVACRFVVDRAGLGFARLFASGGLSTAPPGTADLTAFVTPSDQHAYGAHSALINGWIRFEWRTDPFGEPTPPFAEKELLLRRTGPRTFLYVSSLRAAAARARARATG